MCLCGRHSSKTILNTAHRSLLRLPLSGFFCFSRLGLAASTWWCGWAGDRYCVRLVKLVFLQNGEKKGRKKSTLLFWSWPRGSHSALSLTIWKETLPAPEAINMSASQSSTLPTLISLPNPAQTQPTFSPPLFRCLVYFQSLLVYLLVESLWTCNRHVSAYCLASSLAPKKPTRQWPNFVLSVWVQTSQQRWLKGPAGRDRFMFL